MKTLLARDAIPASTGARMEQSRNVFLRFREIQIRSTRTSVCLHRKCAHGNYTVHDPLAVSSSMRE